MQHCQVNDAEAVVLRKSPEDISRSIGARRRSPVAESSLPEEAMVYRSQMMTSHSKEIVEAAVETKKALVVDG